MYEALRAYIMNGPPPKWLLPSTTHPDRSKFFATTSAAMPIPTSLYPHARDHDPSPKKSAARDLIVRLRKRNHSVYEISDTLKEQCSLKRNRRTGSPKTRGIRSAACAFGEAGSFSSGSGRSICAVIAGTPCMPCATYQKPTHKITTARNIQKP